MTDPAAIAASLSEAQRERITGWQGLAGSAYNFVSEDLCEMGLLNADWSLSEIGFLVRAHLQENSNAS